MDYKLQNWLSHLLSRKEPLVMYPGRTEVNNFNTTNGDMSGFCTVQLFSKDKHQIKSAKAQLAKLKEQQKLPAGLEVFDDRHSGGLLIHIGFKSDLTVPRDAWYDNQNMLAADALRKAAIGLEVPFAPADENRLSPCSMTALWHKLNEVIKEHFPQAQIKRAQAL